MIRSVHINPIANTLYGLFITVSVLFQQFLGQTEFSFFYAPIRFAWWLFPAWPWIRLSSKAIRNQSGSSLLLGEFRLTLSLWALAAAIFALIAIVYLPKASKKPETRNAFVVLTFQTRDTGTES